MKDKLSKFNEMYSGSLNIKLSKQARPISKNLYNMTTPKNTKIIAIKFEASVTKEDEYVEPNEEDLAKIVINKPTITLNSIGGSATIKAPNAEYFTVGDLLWAIEETEKQTRGNTNWFGGIDIHHIYFEGIDKSKNGYTIYWGS